MSSWWDDLTPEQRREHSEKIKQGQRRSEARGSDEHLQTPEGSPAPTDDAAPPQDTLGELSQTAEPVVDPGEAAAERRRRLLGDVPLDLAARITEAQLDKLEADKAKIEAEELERAQNEVLKNVLANVREEAKVRARVAAGLVSDDVLRTEAELRYMNEEIEFRIDVPLGAMPSGKEGIHVNGFLYQYNLIYKRPRHVFASLHETMYRAQMAELKFSLMNQQKPGMSAGHIYNKTPLRVVISEPKAAPHAA